ncbi:MAG TPA: hypothetical protein VE866_11890 [Candidatus Binatia bacterium]|nr:hypothetical protein [Candidatus Binatia bacterium]
MKLTRIVFCLALITCASVASASDDECKGFTFFPDGTYVAAVCSHAGSEFIYKVSLATGVATKLTNADQGFEGLPSFSADGTRMAYSYSPGGKVRSHIVIANIDGSEPHPWPISDTSDLRPVFLADNEHILFARAGYYGHYSPIARPALHEWTFYLADLDGANVHPIIGGGFYYVTPASVSPDGQKVLFVNKGDVSEVIEVHPLPPTSEPVTFIRPPVEVEHRERIIAAAMYMPDGKSILFSAATDHLAHYDYDIYRMDLQTQKVDRLTRNLGYAHGLQLSRDGKTAIFMRDSSHWFRNKTEIFLLDIATRKLAPFTITGIDQAR